MMDFEYILILALFSISFSIAMTIPKCSHLKYVPTILTLISLAIAGFFLTLATLNIMMR